ncbi:stage V sporulation protein K [Zalerion maritima]|uniref:Stage V sporulation protein K n=1 Tax=Zalerion maritima TaxID=339359 RepID=A0AAD5RSE3_9PEZI|nr:stage V sporulation protein K [Zalerion maritima]
MSAPGDRRIAKLTKLFHVVCEGKELLNVNEAKLFLEACRSRPSPSNCVEKLISRLRGLRRSMTIDTSPAFVTANTVPFVQFISDPSVASIADGSLLQQTLVEIVEPPTLWSVLMKLFSQHALDEEGLLAFAWLLSELVSLPPRTGLDFGKDGEAVMRDGSLQKSSSHAVRTLHSRIQHRLRIRTTASAASSRYAPGGRHDNDHADFHDVEVLPTADEFMSKEKPYYRTAREVEDADCEMKPGMHLDNQFRLLREDMLPELRESLQAAIEKKKGGRRAQILSDLRLEGIFLVDTRGKQQKCSIEVSCGKGMEALPRGKEQRTKFIKESPWFLKHQSFGALCRNDEIVAFAFVDRIHDGLLKEPPLFGLQFPDDAGLRRSLMALKFPQHSRFIVVDTPVFAYEPVLKGLQNMTELPFEAQLLDLTSVCGHGDTHAEFRSTANAYRARLESGQRIRVSSRGKEVTLDDSQAECIINFLTHPVSIGLGPPGRFYAYPIYTCTGKSFSGAQIVKHAMELTGYKVLIITYTHHALDDALSHLLGVGIQANDIVRLGSKAKATETTASMALSEQDSAFRRSHTSWDVINKKKAKATDLATKIRSLFREFCDARDSMDSFKELWEFSETDAHFFNAFDVPQEQNGFKVAGRRNRVVQSSYLFNRWARGNDAGIFNKHAACSDMRVWGMPYQRRLELLTKWSRDLVEGRSADFQEAVSQYNAIQDEVKTLLEDRDIHILASKRVIGCTTTAAAKYHRIIKAAKPDIVVVEEAGEILESHVLVALTPTVKQLVLIGDHKQLRPKVNNYGLTVEKGDGYDLNKSLFERLILQGMSHVALTLQHRSHPDLSKNIRELTYPHLEDGPKTSSLEPIRGLRDRLVFVNHDKLEDDESRLREKRDPTMKSSKKNTYEAQMVLRCVRFLVQQGYKTDDIVVLTPYLGQLFVLKDLLSGEHDPWLDDIDSYELIRAGLVSEAAGKLAKKRLRISTVDNYQGEECDIVIVSTTRSNENGDIGFMAAPERLNVLLSRARKGLIMIGNMATFLRSRKGTTAWPKLFDMLRRDCHLYDGLPVMCQQHPEKKALLREPMDFDRYAPDGGCAEPCDTMLSCRVHRCPRRCHRLADHTQTSCNERVEKTCKRGHKYKIACRLQNETCRKCLEEDKETERRAKRDLSLERDRIRRQAKYKQELQEIQDEIDHEKRKIRYREEQNDQAKQIQAEREALASIKATVARVQKKDMMENAKKQEARSAPNPESHPLSDLPSNAKEEWDSLKELEGASNTILDELMGMIGLEEVKAEFLNIKSRVDTSIRQDIQLTKERFSASLLGNPGTGKTTVARLYAKFLTSVGVIPGSIFEETTGASLANEGVSGCKKLLEKILNNGGGVLFVDEAYQLTSGQNPGGGAILDFLLAEVENLTGKVVFVLAGYNKQMESFFAHNPGIPSRFPVEMKFSDYTDDELLRIMELKIRSKFQGRMKSDDGPRGLYFRIASRRLGRGRGTEGFGNARAVENIVVRICTRQAVRLRRERQRKQNVGKGPDDLFLTQEDIIGPEPGEAVKKSDAWRKLQSLIGLKAVKQAIQTLLDTLGQNYKRELKEEPPIEYSLNKVFLGNPGTGKTTVAKLYGEILADLGLLSKREVVTKVPADFVGAALGQSEKQTKGILESTVGKVLVIDEAYALYGGGDSQGATSDPYKTAVVDTIVSQVHNVPGDDRCVLLLGYKDELEKMFQNVNPGFSRRFPLASAFEFEDFDEEGLGKVLDLRLKQEAFSATPQARKIALEVLNRARSRPKFGNGGEVQNVLDAAKARHQQAYSSGKTPHAAVLGPCDFDPDFDRDARSDTNIDMLFAADVGREAVVAKLKKYQQAVKATKSLGMDPKEAAPFNFLFRGPPGTGKTTTAKKIGKVFYDMGFLATAEVVECSATDLMGQYVGQTGPKVQAQLDKALGRVLFIDEAYRLSQGAYGKEAMDELVDAATKEKYERKLIIILAGYDHDINALMAMNPGLTSRFPETIEFRHMQPVECTKLLVKSMRQRGDELKSKGKGRMLDISALEKPASTLHPFLSGMFEELSQLSGWANARDVLTLANSLWRQTISPPTDLVVTEDMVRDVVGSMLRERKHRASASICPLSQPQVGGCQTQGPPPRKQPRVATENTITEQPPPEPQEEDKKVVETESVKPDGMGPNSGDARRDAGVSDEVWEQLQRDRKAEQEREAEYQQLLEEQKNSSDADRERIVRKVLEEEERRRKAAEIKQKLMVMGKCPAGFEWIEQDGDDVTWHERKRRTTSDDVRRRDTQHTTAALATTNPYHLKTLSTERKRRRVCISQGKPIATSLTTTTFCPNRGSEALNPAAATSAPGARHHTRGHDQP